MLAKTSGAKGTPVTDKQKTTRELLTVHAAAKRLCRSVPSLRRDVRRRKIGFVKIGGSIRFPVEEIERTIASGWVERKTS